MIPGFTITKIVRVVGRDLLQITLEPTSMHLNPLGVETFKGKRSWVYMKDPSTYPSAIFSCKRLHIIVFL